MHFWFYQARFGDTVAVSEIVATTAIQLRCMDRYILYGILYLHAVWVNCMVGHFCQGKKKNIYMKITDCDFVSHKL